MFRFITTISADGQHVFALFQGTVSEQLFPFETQHMVNLAQKTAIFNPLKLSTKKTYHQNGFETGETALVSQKLTKFKFETTLVSQKKTFFENTN